MHHVTFLKHQLRQMRENEVRRSKERKVNSDWGTKWKRRKTLYVSVSLWKDQLISKSRQYTGHVYSQIIKWHPLQYSYLGSPVDRRAWQATVQGVTESQTWLGDQAHIHIIADMKEMMKWSSSFHERDDVRDCGPFFLRTLKTDALSNYLRKKQIIKDLELSM